MGIICDIDKKDVRWAMHESTLLGPLGAFAGPADTIAIAGVWASLLVFMMSNHGKNISKENAGIICKGVAKGAVKYYAGCKVAATAFNAIPVAGTLVGMGISTVANIIYTYSFAYAITKSCLTNNSFSGSNISASNIVDNFLSEFKKSSLYEICDIYANPKYGYGKEVVESIKETAEDVKDKIVEWTDNVKNSPQFNKIKEKTSDVTDKITYELTNIAVDIDDAVTDMTKKVSATIKKWWNGY